MMRKPRHRDHEVLARLMLMQCASITPHRLADRANITWLVARNVLRGLVKKGHATALKNGRFGVETKWKHRTSGVASVA
jgi:ribosomal protein S25